MNAVTVTQQPTLGICIVNWNSGGYLLSCLQSIKTCLENNYRLVQVVVVDNNSADNSIELIEAEKANLPLKIIKKSVNLGFARACNIGASYLNTDYVLFLNPDSSLFPDTIDKSFELEKKLAKDNVAVIGAQVIGTNGSIARSCARFPSVRQFFNDFLGLCEIFPSLFQSYRMKDWSHENSSFVDHVIGAFYLIKRRVFEELQGFDERFFVYLEDLDLSKRVVEGGYKIYYSAEVKLKHIGGGCSNNILARRLYYSLSSKLKYVAKHFSFCKRIFLYFTILCLGPIMRIGYALLRFRFADVKNTVKAYCMLLTG